MSGETGSSDGAERSGRASLISLEPFTALRVIHGSDAPWLDSCDEHRNEEGRGRHGSTDLMTECKEAGHTQAAVSAAILRLRSERPLPIGCGNRMIGPYLMAGVHERR
ncbi:hypothetical protein EHS39_15550 [Ensifer sp. MPMI2T]|nr:hypothetical protein EHS39_15550 [Ensifer sp. MPMI2T]